ncbi:MAG TPA: methyltransferase domain-containing protein [Gemmatimonadales bacterium]|nr:methyltransferase domain-containing protein [Gemmatimonadales bacterium]
MISPPEGTELLDDLQADPDAVRLSLHNITRANRWFGGQAAAAWGIARLLGDVPRGATVSLLDIGTGSGDLPHAVVRWAARRGVVLKAVGLERHPVAAALARQSGLPTILACASRLPVRRRGVDVVLISQVAHHLTPEGAAGLFQAASEIARRGVVVADLRRSALALNAFRVGARMLRFDALTIADGVTSVRRGFTEAGLVTLLARAGISADVRRRPGFRLVASWKTN